MVSWIVIKDFFFLLLKIDRSNIYEKHMEDVGGFYVLIFKNFNQ